MGRVADVVWPPDMAVGGTDRDWHGHTPSEVEVSRAADCVVPAVDAAAAPSGGLAVGAAGILAAAVVRRRGGPGADE